MDFVSGLLKNKKGSDFIWVIVDRLTKSALFLLVKMIDFMDKLARLNVNDVIRLYKVLVSNEVYIKIMPKSATSHGN
jgi:hypothetical protein